MLCCGGGKLKRVRGRGNAGVGVNISEGAGEEKVIDGAGGEMRFGLTVEGALENGVGASSDEKVGSRSSAADA